ncbi:MAG: deoxyribodipyrimidine photo-lyase, partial [Bacteroidota bacterium]
MNRIIHWFTSDLRLHDMPSLHAASHAEALLPVYIFSTESEVDSPHGFPRIGPFRKTFLKQTLLALKESLQVKNSELFILEGNPEEILPELVRIFDINCIHVEEPIASEEINCINAVEQAVNIPVRRFESRTFYTEQQLPFALQQLPGTFTTFRTLMESSQGYDVNELVDIDLPPLPISKDTIEHQWTWKDDGIYIKPDPRSALK